ncbi:MAG: acetylglucosamine-6-sulfatase [Planctomycetaceae bacterium]|nr:acetylglucosamine-6-sulfatase [Planctomycetaceae bacterium]
MRFNLLPTVLLLLTPLAASKLTAAEADNPKKTVKAVTPENRTDKWWSDRHTQKLKASKNQSVDLLMIGDSITHGWEGHGKKVWQEYYAQRNAFNIGYSGDRTEHVIWRLQHGEIDSISPQLAVVMIGTNNTGHRQDPPAETAAGIKQILVELRQRKPQMKVLLLAIFPRGATADDKLRKINTSINEYIKQYADGKSIFFLDLNSAFLDDRGRLPKSVMPDLLHPHEAGYRRWAKAMEPTILKLLAQ